MTKTPNVQNTKNPNSTNVSKFQKQDLEIRLGSFFERVIILCKKCTINALTSRIISQLSASSGSIATNYAEASEAMSRKDFVKSIKICRKESKETKVWLKGLKIAVNIEVSEFDNLIQEVTEFVYIFTSILKKTDIK